MMDVPILKSERLRLRPFTSTDEEALYEILNGQDILKYFPGSGSVSREGARRMILGMTAHWEDRGYGLWAVASQATGELLGRCGLQYLQDTDEVEVDFIIGREYWGRGYATEAALAGLSYGFEKLALDSIVGIVHLQNGASQRVLEKIGMANCGRAVYFGMDVYRYERFNTNYQP